MRFIQKHQTYEISIKFLCNYQMYKVHYVLIIKYPLCSILNLGHCIKLLKLITSASSA